MQVTCGEEDCQCSEMSNAMLSTDGHDARGLHKGYLLIAKLPPEDL